ncbi:VOC family protein [Nocardioides conyzicola]|uniref:VOC family protein n=1 Tax=Nocardioides conyzicola TaxID=1651781 RepID=A0ABP8WNE0_9ACTN
MPARVTPYLNFPGNAREAMEFYQSIFGGELDITSFADIGRAADPSQEKLVAHSMLRGATGVVLMASDSPTPQDHQGAGAFSVALGGDAADLTAYWTQLASGGTVSVPFATSAWGSMHGQCTDKFGTAWQVNVTGAPAS